MGSFCVMLGLLPKSLGKFSGFSNIFDKIIVNKNYLTILFT